MSQFVCWTCRQPSRERMCRPCYYESDRQGDSLRGRFREVQDDLDLEFRRSMRALVRLMAWAGIESRFQAARRAFNGDYGRADALAEALRADKLKLTWPDSDSGP